MRRAGKGTPHKQMFRDALHGGTVLETAVRSAINEPRPHHLRIIEDLLKAGARAQGVVLPTGHEAIDTILRGYQSV